MSLASLNFLFRADTENFERSLKRSKKSVDTFGDGIKAMGKMLAGAIAIDQIFAFGKASVKAFDEADKAAAKLLTTMDGNTEATKRLINQSGLLQSNSLFSDDAIQGAQMFLASMKLNETQISRLIPLIMDFSTKTGMDLDLSANLMAKTIGSGTNALKRYGVEVEGAAGSSERFEATVAGLTKMVGGLSEAATKAGVSGIQQLANNIDNLQESIGGVIAKGLNPLLEKLNTLFELQAGATGRNYATSLVLQGKGFASQGESIDDARNALRIYIEERKKLRGNFNEQVISSQNEQAKLINQIGVGKHTYWDTIIENAKQNLEGNEDAIKQLEGLIENNAEFEKWYKEIKSGTGKSGFVSGIEDQIKALKEEQSTLQEIDSIRNEAIKKEIAGLEEKKKKFEGLEKPLSRIESIQEKIKNLNEQYDGTSDMAKQRAIQTTIDKLTEQLDIEERLRGINAGRDVSISAMKTRQTFKPTAKYIPGIRMPVFQTSQLPLNSLKELSTSLKDNTTLWNQLTPVIENNASITEEAMTKSTTSVDALGDSLTSLGQQLSQGADSWQEFGKMAKNAVREAAIGIIASFAAIAVAGAIKNTILGPAGKLGPIGVALGALAGGLTAGVFATAIPKFGKGGFVPSPQLIIAGDSSDGKGEFILNTPQMKSLISRSGGQTIRVVGNLRGRGRDLYAVFQTESEFQKRTGGMG